MLKTIEEQEKIIPNRYTLTKVVSLRVNELLKGARPKISRRNVTIIELYKNGLTFGGAKRIALEEIRLGLLPYCQTTIKPTAHIENTSTVVFTS